MLELRLHGRGGQGIVTAAEILADAVFREGKWSQKIPDYSGERRGAPVRAYVRIDDKKVTLYCPIEAPDAVICLDVSLSHNPNIFKGLKEGGLVLINDVRDPEEANLDVKPGKIATVDGNGISMEIFGPRAIAITNTCILGALSAATGWVKLESLFDPIKERFPQKIAEANLRAAKLGYERVKVKQF